MEADELNRTERFSPPSLIIQDELHLIEGPLGSMVGIYEMAVDVLATEGEQRPKYIASSATIKEADSQVGTIFRREIDCVSITLPTIMLIENPTMRCQ